MATADTGAAYRYQTLIAGVNGIFPCQYSSLTITEYNT
jgi:hypothetical protein